MDQRKAYLERTANLLIQAAGSGQLVKRKRIPVQVGVVRGPRAGAVELHCGIHAKQVLKALDSATVRQFISWDFAGEPVAYLPPGSRAVRVEAGWPVGLSEKDVTLFSLNNRPRSPSHFVVGKNEQGTTIVTSLDDEKPGYLVGGETGGGKTLALRSICAQTSGAAWDQPSGTKLVLIDGKRGEGLGPVSTLPGVVGPMATDPDNARNALGWSLTEMQKRYDRGLNGDGRILVVVDEAQTFTDDDLFTDMLRQLVNQGRAAKVHVIVGTQHPTVKVLNDSTLKHGLVGRIGLRVTSPEASRVVFGGPTPRADYLHGCGDSYVMTPSSVQRVQWAYIPTNELEKMSGAQPELAEWPEWEAEKDPTRFSGQELAVALLHVNFGSDSRDGLKGDLEKVLGTMPGSPRASAMLALARSQAQVIRKLGFGICRT